MATQTAPVESAQILDNGEFRPVQSTQIEVALQEILRSTPFKTSKQSQQLLQYIVQETASGHFELLKERIIGARVFGRRADYDTNDDPIVRTRAGEVRKRLAQYYLSEGRERGLRIAISPGSYHASFVASPMAPPVAAAPKADEITPLRPIASIHEPEIGQAKTGITITKSGLLSTRTRLAGVVIIVSVAVACSLLLLPQKPIEAFWQPLLESKKPVVIYSGANAVYMLSAEFMNRYKASHRLDTLEDKGQEFVVPISPDTTINASDLVPFKNEFVTLGDLSANVRVASLLTIHKKTFDMRSGEDVAFSDLHESPSLLVGAFNNRWTMELTGDLPFTFEQGLTIRDRNDKNRSWTPVFSKEGTVVEDYAIVTRIPHSKSDQPLITVAGITQSGTRAAADFITSPQMLNDFLKSAPANWTQKSMQVLLQTKVVNNIPTAPVVIAARYW